MANENKLSSLKLKMKNEGHSVSLSVQHYEEVVKESIEKLDDIWESLDMSKNEKEREIGKIFQTSCNAWQNAINVENGKKQAVENSIKNAKIEICEICEALGEEVPNDQIIKEYIEKKNDEKIEKLNVKKIHICMKELLEIWKEKKKNRLMEIRNMQEAIKDIKQYFGTNHRYQNNNSQQQQNDISSAYLSILRFEFNNCCNEKMKREEKLNQMIEELKNVCNDIGLDYMEYLDSINFTLKIYEENNRKEELKEVKEARPDLSDKTFETFELTMIDLKKIKEERMERLNDIKRFLMNLWNALSIEEEEEERKLYTLLIEGSSRLHKTTHDKCIQEINRLENAKAQMIEQIIESKIEEIRRLCVSTHIPIPDLNEIIEHHMSMNTNDSQKSTDMNIGKSTDVLSKLCKMIVDIKIIIEKRKDIIKMIGEFENGKEEVMWLKEYEADENRYKGRDSNRKLQRSIKASRVRDKMPNLIERIKNSIKEWEGKEKQSFLYDGINFVRDVIDPFEVMTIKKIEINKNTTLNNVKKGNVDEEMCIMSPKCGNEKQKNRSMSKVNIKDKMKEKYLNMNQRSGGIRKVTKQNNNYSILQQQLQQKHDQMMKESKIGYLKNDMKMENQDDFIISTAITPIKKSNLCSFKNSKMYTTGKLKSWYDIIKNDDMEGIQYSDKKNEYDSENVLNQEQNKSLFSFLTPNKKFNEEDGNIIVRPLTEDANLLKTNRDIDFSCILSKFSDTNIEENKN